MSSPGPAQTRRAALCFFHRKLHLDPLLDTDVNCRLCRRTDGPTGNDAAPLLAVLLMNSGGGGGGGGGACVWNEDDGLMKSSRRGREGGRQKREEGEEGLQVNQPQRVGLRGLCC